MLTQTTKKVALDENLFHFKAYVKQMRTNENFEFSKLRRKIRAFVKTSQIGNYYRITLKHSKRTISFSQYFNQALGVNVFTLHYNSKFPLLDKMVLHCKDDKEFLEKILFNHKLYDNE